MSNAETTGWGGPDATLDQQQKARELFEQESKKTVPPSNFSKQARIIENTRDSAIIKAAALDTGKGAQ